MFLGITAVFETLKLELKRVAGDNTPVSFHDTGDLLTANCGPSQDGKRWVINMCFPLVSDSEDEAFLKAYLGLHEIGHAIDGRRAFEVLKEI